MISQRGILFILFPVTAVAASLAAADPVALKFDLASAHHLEARPVVDGAVELKTRGVDPYLQLQALPDRLPATHTVLAFEYFAPDRIDDLRVYYGPPFTATRHFDAGSLERAESWLPYAVDLATASNGKWSAAFNRLRLDFGQRAGRTLRIRNLHLRPPNAEERRSRAARDAARQAKLAREARIDAFYEATFPDRIDSVAVDAEFVTVRGRIARHNVTAGAVSLLEIRPHISLAERAAQNDGSFLLEARDGIRPVTSWPRGRQLGDNGTFQHRLPRHAEGYDRTTSRWALADAQPDGRWRLRSAWRYATDLSAAAAHRLPPAQSAGIKGMGGVDPRFPLEELTELGIRHITINIPLGNLLTTRAQPGWPALAHGGHTWYAHPGHLAAWDRLARFAFEHDIVVSGILLVTFSQGEFGKLLIHPEADRAGQYAMPNFTSAEGVAAYEAALEFLARRYCQPGFPHGRIANWIVHNEVGYGWEWTNMGLQPPMLYMDHYLRSMRLVHDVMRRHDPHARVFISLTHHWNIPSDPHWKSYSNRDLLDRLCASSRIEGDFAWGVAYHPYPQSLWKADAWNDTRVTDDFDTPLITPKNIAVLDRWMRRPQMQTADGKVRGLLLSEQGVHSPDDSPASERLQAAGLVYMWRQVRALESVEAFHYHRWVDHPNEGGLLLGLRRLPAGGKPYGKRKLAWDVYRALDTPREKTATAFADEFIPTSPNR